MAETFDFSRSNSSIKLIGSDMSMKLRDSEKSYLILYLTLF